MPDLLNQILPPFSINTYTLNTGLPGKPQNFLDPNGNNFFVLDVSTGPLLFYWSVSDQQWLTNPVPLFGLFQSSALSTNNTSATAISINGPLVYMYGVSVLGIRPKFILTASYRGTSPQQANMRMNYAGGLINSTTMNARVASPNTLPTTDGSSNFFNNVLGLDDPTDAGIDLTTIDVLWPAIALNTTNSALNAVCQACGVSMVWAYKPA